MAPPMTQGERDALRVAVQQCWNVGSLSSEALRTTVVVSVEMSQDGRPDSGSIRMVSSSGGGEAAKQAFEAARRAISIALVAEVADVYMQLRDLDARLTLAIRTRDARNDGL